MTRVGEGTRWLVLAIVPGAAFAVSLAMHPPLGLEGLDSGSVEEVLLTGGRWLGLTLTGWLVATQLLYTIAVVTRIDWMADVLRPVTLPIVRRIAASAVAVTMSMSTVVAGAQTTPDPTVVVFDEGANSGLRQEATPTPVLEPLAGAEPCLVSHSEGSYSAPLVWQVRPGDHLWSIAGEHLAIVLDRPPTRDEHRTYWVKVVDSARPLIRSGDPDLIYPGEEIPLPAMLEAGITP